MSQWGLVANFVIACFLNFLVQTSAYIEENFMLMYTFFANICTDILASTLVFQAMIVRIKAAVHCPNVRPANQRWVAA